MNKGFYLYCIIDSPKEIEIDLLGIDKLHQPYIIPCQEVGVLVSRVSLADYCQQELERKARNLEWLQEKADRHEKIIEQVMEKAAVIPISFGTIFEKEIKLKGAIQQSLSEIKMIFTEVEGHEEWGLKLYCDFPQLRETISDLSSEIEELEQRIENSNEGTAYFLKRRLEIELDKKVEEKAFSIADEIYDELAQLATKSHLNELIDLELDDISESMILNSVYLVSKEKLSDFLLRLKELKDKYSEFGFCFYYSGPWPPYNFSSLKLNGCD